MIKKATRIFGGSLTYIIAVMFNFEVNTRHPICGGLARKGKAISDPAHASQQYIDLLLELLPAEYRKASQASNHQDYGGRFGDGDTVPFQS